MFVNGKDFDYGPVLVFSWTDENRVSRMKERKKGKVEERRDYEKNIEEENCTKWGKEKDMEEWGNRIKENDRKRDGSKDEERNGDE